MEAETNRHPVDQLADVREMIREMKEREDALRTALMAPGADLCGAEFKGRLVTSVRSVLDRDALEARFGTEAVKACCRDAQSTAVRLVRRRKRRDDE